jgi:hypothetical protein
MLQTAEYFSAGDYGVHVEPRTQIGLIWARRLMITGEQ